MSGDGADGAELALLAAELGVVPGYWDIRGVRHEPGPEALVAVCRALGAELDGPAGAAGARRARWRERLRDGLDPVAVAWDGEASSLGWWLPAGEAGPAQVRLRPEGDGGAAAVGFDVAVADLAVEADDGHGAWVRRRLPLPAGLAVGRWEVVVEAGSRRWGATVVSAPRRLPTPEPWERAWGVFAPVHALGGAGPVGEGPSLADLDRLGAWIHRHGGQVVATLPLLASYLGGPGGTSPYDPVSRRFWNELYLDLDALPGLPPGALPPAPPEPVADRRAGGRGGATGPLGVGVGVGGRGSGAGAGFDHAGRAARVRAALEAALAHLGEGLDALPAHRAFLAADPEVARYADFRGAVARHGRTWRAWPERLRRGDLRPGDLDEGEARLHRYAQWAMHVQLGRLAERLAGRGQRLYLDVPVGSSGDGYDTWRHPGLFGWGAEAGAPPDDFFELGQRWGFPPLSPGASRRQGHRFVASCLRAQAGVAGIVRIDHVMQLERVFWVPDGMGATEGVYVRHPREELLATVAVEAHRAGAVVVGEDLGTVPDEVRHAMARHGLLRTHVLQFAVGAPGAGVAPPPHDSVASLGTHDTPTFTAWLRGADVALQHDLGLVDGDRAAELRASRLVQRAELARHLGVADGGEGGEAALVRGALGELAASEAALVLVEVEDLWGEVEPQNVPGTGADRPNWVRRWPCSVAEAAADPALAAALDDVQAARLGAYERARPPGPGGDRT